MLISPVGVESRDSTAVYPVGPPWLATALEYIRSNVAKGLTALQIVEVAGRSYVAVEKAFKQKRGTTIQKEIMSSRLETRKTVPGASRAEALAVDRLASAREARTPRVRCLAAISSPN